jgi:hypothetical protein
MSKSPNDVKKLVEDSKIEIIDLRFVDLPGVWQHFSLPARTLSDDMFTDGLGFDGSSIRGYQQIQESDMLLFPDPETAFIDPVLQVPTLSMICSVRDPVTRERYTRDPRHIARKAEQKRQQAEIEREKREARSCTEKDEQALAQLLPAREQMRQGLNAELVRLYDRVLKTRGNPLAEARDQYCKACHVMMRPQVFQDVINAERVRLTGNKIDQKIYRHHSGHPGGLKEIPIRRMLERQPAEVIREAVLGMLPKNKLRAKRAKKLRVYAGEKGLLRHAGQKPQVLEI